MSFAIRISRPYDEVFEWCDALTADKVAIYEHEADAEVSRTHIHILLLNAKVKPDAMKTRFKKLYGEIDKSDWSFKKADDDGFVTYMSKGKLPPKLTKGYDPVDIERLTREWKDPEAQNITVKLENGKFVREVDTVPKKSKISLLEQMRSELAGSIPTEDSRLRAIRKVLMRNNEVIGNRRTERVKLGGWKWATIEGGSGHRVQALFLLSQLLQVCDVYSDFTRRKVCTCLETKEGGHVVLLSNEVFRRGMWF